MSNRKPLIAGNWKMNKSVLDAIKSSEELSKLVSDVNNVDVMIAPPFTALSLVHEKIKGSLISLGAQNIFWEKQGAYTGEISAEMILSTGCQYVIIGHSERRQYFNETDESVNKKNTSGTFQ